MKNWIPFAVLGTAVFFLLLMQYILKLNEKIKHQAVKPYLVLTGLHMDIDSKTKDKVLNFEVVNEGEDAASRIVLKVYEASTMGLVHTGAFQKLSVMNGVKYKGNKPNYIEVKCHIYGNISNKLSYIAELEYSDIYEKRYKGTFNVRFDANRLRVIECEEKFEELKNV